MTATTQDTPTLSGFFGKWITKNDLLTNPLLEKDIMGKFSRDYIYDSVYIQEKRNLFKELWDKYSNPDAYKSQTFKVHKMHADIKAFEANYRDADLAVLFSDDMSLTEDLAYMLEEAARFDAITMNKEMKDHQKLFNCLLYGASIAVQT